MRQSVRIVIFVFIMMVVMAATLFATSVGMTIGTWSMVPGNGTISDGAYAYFGGTVGLSSRFEAEFFTVVQATPNPLSEIQGGLALTFAFAADREITGGQAPSWLNAYITAGVLQGLQGTQNTSVFLRITPLSVGGPYYHTRERAASVGILYDMTESSFSVFWNIFLFDIYKR
jgi:hypothetical protein